mmetsp:Transcript_50802/g.159822  ORF Transcript_50802/g.159822 Transcript_50802/m.159822 type:complete len:109 (-) Transcript_50802:117-443(-)
MRFALHGSVFLVVLATVAGLRLAGMQPQLSPGGLRDFARPGEARSTVPVGAEPAGLYERRTQSPIVWLVAQKSVIPPRVPTWYNAPYAQDAFEDLGRLDALSALRRAQ